MILLTPGSHAHQILELLLLTGELPYSSLSMLGNERTWRNTAIRMTREATVTADRKLRCCVPLIRISGRGELRTIRLDASSFGFLGAVFPEALQYYLAHFENHHFRGNAGSIRRNHRQAEVVIQLRNAGIECYPKRLPPLSRSCQERMTVFTPGYYPSRYLKSLGFEELNKTKFTRMAGALMLTDECCVVYNCADSGPKWSTSGEQKARADINQIVLRNTTLPVVESALLFGRDMGTGLAVLNGIQDFSGTMTDSNNDYTRKYFLPMDDFGARMLELMSLPNWRQRLLELMFLPESLEGRMTNLCYDAYENGEYILLFMDCDLQKLNQFYAQVCSLQCKWSVLCFAQQKPFLRSVMGDRALLRTHDFHEVLNAMKEGSEEK